MAKSPRCEKRPAEVASTAVKVAKIATCEAGDRPRDGGDEHAGGASGARGGKARAWSLTKKQREQIAREVVQSRWRNED